jgi:hypothetical protein
MNRNTNVDFGGLTRRTFQLTRMAAGACSIMPLLEDHAFAQSGAISYVGTSLSGSQKFVLGVDAMPYLLASIQVRLDGLRYWWKWRATMRDGTIGQTSSDGFDTATIPIHWYEVEPSKGNFD